MTLPAGLDEPQPERDARREMAEARACADHLGKKLPPSVSAVALGVKSKAPFQLLWARGALMWRTEELARNACDALERDEFAVAAILTRAVMESAALASKLNEVLAARHSRTPQEVGRRCRPPVAVRRDANVADQHVRETPIQGSRTLPQSDTVCRMENAGFSRPGPPVHRRVAPITCFPSWSSTLASSTLGAAGQFQEAQDGKAVGPNSASHGLCHKKRKTVPRR